MRRAEHGFQRSKLGLTLEHEKRRTIFLRQLGCHRWLLRVPGGTTLAPKQRGDLGRGGDRMPQLWGRVWGRLGREHVWSRRRVGSCNPTRKDSRCTPRSSRSVAAGQPGWLIAWSGSASSFSTSPAAPSVVGALGRTRGAADPEALHLRERAGRLRDARRPREPARPASRLIALPVTRIRAHSSRPGVPIFRLAGRPRHHEHGLPRGQAAHRPGTTSCSSVTAASTDRRGSTAPRWSRRASTRAICSHAVLVRCFAVAYRPAPRGFARRASISPATRCPSESTTSRSHAARSATA